MYLSDCLLVGWSVCLVCLFLLIKKKMANVELGQFMYHLFNFFFFRYGSGKKGVAHKATPTPPLSAKSSNSKPKSSGRAKTKSHNSQDKQSNLSSPYAFSLNATPSPAAKQGIPLGQSLLVVTIKDKTVKVHMPTDSAPRSPTLVECKAIIKHQQETNKRQEQEVMSQ